MDKIQSTRSRTKPKPFTFTHMNKKPAKNIADRLMIWSAKEESYDLNEFYEIEGLTYRKFKNLCAQYEEVEEARQRACQRIAIKMRATYRGNMSFRPYCSDYLHMFDTHYYDTIIALKQASKETQDTHVTVVNDTMINKLIELSKSDGGMQSRQVHPKGLPDTSD